MSSPRREFACFAAVLAGLVIGLLRDSVLGGKVLSPADVLLVSASFRDVEGASDEPLNRLLMDPVLQFQPWLDLNRAAFREGRLPTWNPYAGCGAPQLANGQSAFFDPFHLLAYLGPLPDALAWIAAGRLWLAGLGMFLLARQWGLGPWGRWFAGLAFPFTGFLIVWLLFPVTAAAAWMPWVLLTASRLLDRPSPRRTGQHAAAVGLCLLGGHIQTSAHVLLSMGLYVAWEIGSRRRAGESGLARAGIGWAAATLLGVGIGSVVTIPLGVYLTKSPVWQDRRNESPGFLSLGRPRVLDAACTAVPYVYGSQRRGHPNLARALGVHNLNESAGGYAGLATLVWLAPGAWRRRRTVPIVGFLGALLAVGFLGGFGIPPVANLLRVIPVLDVIDPRRMTLWVAFSLTLLGGIGLDRLAETLAGSRDLLLAVAGLMLLGLAPVVPAARPWLEARSRSHYAQSARIESPGETDRYQARADRQVRYTVAFVPGVLAATGLELLALAGLGLALSRGRIPVPAGRAGLLALTIVELFAFADGMNPAIDRSLDRPVSAVVARLRDKLEPGQRLIGVGQEFPPNTAMRYGLSDARNYDSVELSRTLAWFRPLHEPEADGRPRTSRSTITWEGVFRALDRLEASSVAAVVSPSPPPEPLRDRAEPVGSAWITWLNPAPLATIEPSGKGQATLISRRPGALDIEVTSPEPATLIIRETFDEGWRATVGTTPAAIRPHRDVFLCLAVPKGTSRVTLRHEPAEIRLAVGLSAASLLIACGCALSGDGLVRGQNPLRGLGSPETIGLESNS